uniref:Uncharacterized protein n=1 Tax=Aegilops tauschii subsp. strangulata TaxID=200361 RepID=A0A452ZEQ1_AEGTS
MDAASLLPFAIALVAIPISLALLDRLRLGRLPPGPRPWPVVGNLRQIKPVRCRCFQEWAERYGPIISVWFGSSLTVVVSTSELAKEVLKEHDQQLADRPRNRSTQRFSRNGQDLIWADYGPHYIKVRKLCNLELFTQKRLEALRSIREDEVTAMVESVHRAAAGPGKLPSQIARPSYFLFLFFPLFRPPHISETDSVRACVPFRSKRGWLLQNTGREVSSVRRVDVVSSCLVGLVDQLLCRVDGADDA